ncbi:MAG: hypothetical protein CMJ35_00720 [Phycisphaerae bacterium]|nr:hypothetical protein [Phycisphaerae bacterium]
MIWNFVYWVLLSIAVVLLLRGLLWDRAGFRGRAKRRCRKCWYDLTGVDGDVTKGPVVCPECGKVHKTKRSMRKTRRGKKWVAAAVMVWAMAYGASVTPKVQKNGWGAAVPRVVLVMSLPFLSEEQGSGLGPFVFRPQILNGSPFDRFVLEEMPPNEAYYFYSMQYQDGPALGWFSRRLVFLLARFQRTDVITDGTTARGRAFKSLISQFVHMDACYSFESAWASKQATIDIEIEHDFGPDETPMGMVRMRRLLLGPYRVRFGDTSTVYSGGSPSSMRMNGITSSFDTVEEEREHWVKRFLWDDLNPAGRVYGDRRAAYLPGYQLSKGTAQGDGSARGDVRFVIYRYIGKDNSGINTDALWEMDCILAREIRYALNASRTVTADSSLVFEDDIERSFAAELGVEYEQGRDQWVPVVRLSTQSGMKVFEDDIIFGGNLAIVAVNPEQPDGRGKEYLRGRGDTFWAWGRERYFDVPAYRSPSGDLETRRDLDERQHLRVRTRFSGYLPGELDGNDWSLREKNAHQTKIVLRMTYQHRTRSAGFSGLWGDRVYDGVLEFDIPKWTVRDLRQFIVNGIVPDHAMP